MGIPDHLGATPLNITMLLLLLLMMMMMMMMTTTTRRISMEKLSTNRLSL